MCKIFSKEGYGANIFRASREMYAIFNAQTSNYLIEESFGDLEEHEFEEYFSEI